MKIQIVTIGRMKEGFSYLQAGIDDYCKRLKPYAQVSILELTDEPIRPSRTSEQIMAAEASRIIPCIERADYAIALWEQGDKLNSNQFSQRFFERIQGDPSNGGISSGASGTILFIVGGALGLHASVIEHCQWTLSLSPMTFPHPMVRLILLEQIYRAFKISRGEPYHK